MKILSKILIFVAIIMSSVAFNVVNDDPKLENLTLNTSQIRLKVGESEYLSVYAYPHQVDISNALWASSNSNIAKVSDSGCVEAKNPGETQIFVMCGDVSTSCIVTVLPIEVETIYMSAPYDEISIGEELQITTVIEPSNASYTNLVWTSSNADVASVSDDGLVKGLSEGSSEITATAHNGVAKVWYVTVKKNIEATGVSLNYNQITVTRHDTQRVLYSVFPGNASNKEVEWESSNENIVTITDDGIIKGIKAGKATIKVTTKNGKTDTCTIVVEEIHAHTVYVNTSDFKNLYIGKEIQIRLTNKYPSSSTYRIEDATFTSYNTAIATVSETGLVTITGKGTTMISVNFEKCISVIHITVI